MPYNKFTYEQIIKALECCKSPIPMCDDCPVGESDMCFDFLKWYAIDLIKCQKAEIDTLKAMIEAAEDHYNPLPFKGIFDEKIAEAKAEAIREFVERLKLHLFLEHGDLTVVSVEDIDYLVKEMTEDEK